MIFPLFPSLLKPLVPPCSLCLFSAGDFGSHLSKNTATTRGECARCSYLKNKKPVPPVLLGEDGVKERRLLEL